MDVPMLSMNTAIEAALDLEEIDPYTFRSKSLWAPPGARGVFGGHIIGQSLMAAVKTVPDSFILHSIHSYFVLPGNANLPILYDVKAIRDGVNFCTRTVVARQKGKSIYTCEMSFHKKELGGAIHQSDMPVVPGPESFISQKDEYSKILGQAKIPPKVAEVIRKRLEEPFPVEFRSVQQPRNSMKEIVFPEPKPAKQYLWFKANGTLPNPDKMLAVHQCAAAYASDHSLLSTSLLPHGLSYFHPDIKTMATLDHCMWFHDSFRADEWLLHEMESHRAIGQRALVFSKIYTRDGRLVISCAQEGLIRRSKL